jgi:hypothetical protein
MNLRPRFIAGWLFIASTAFAADPQNPSPMVEHTREHPRLKEEHPAGKREQLSAGTLFLPANLAEKSEAPLLLFMHGGSWIPEVAAAKHQMACITIQRSDGYRPLFEAKGAFEQILTQASGKAKVRWSNITVAGWSAGCQGIRQIMRDPSAVKVIDRVLMIDGIHTSYTTGSPGPLESKIETEPLQPIAAFAREAIAGQKRLLVTHSEIFPGTFASTTETADWLLGEVGVARRAILEWGPMKTQMLSDAHKGAFRLVGFAGNSAPDHVDQLHALPVLLEWLDALASHMDSGSTR